MPSIPLEQLILRKAPQLLAQHLGLSADQANTMPMSEDLGADLALRHGDQIFLVQCKFTGHTAQVSSAIAQLQRIAATRDRHAIPILAVPYMGEVGQTLCDQARISWLDLSGNAHIIAPGLRVHILGQPNQFKKPGRPKNLFAAKSSRITRFLLMNALTYTSPRYIQAELAKGAQVKPGFTSKIVKALEDHELVERLGGGAIRLRDPDLILDAWREAYDFSSHHVIQGHVPTRSGEETLRHLASTFTNEGLQHAATGLGAAWLLTHHAGFRMTTFFLDAIPTEDLLSKLDFRTERRGSNVWLAVPKDQGVFLGAEPIDGIKCAHPVQVYLDLKSHPERAVEAAEHLRQERLNWRQGRA